MILYLVSKNAESILSAIEASGLLRGSTLEVRRALKVPVGKEQLEQAVVVIDLTNPPAGLQPPMYSATARVSYVLLVAHDQTIAIPWVEFGRSGPVELLSLHGERPSTRTYRPLVSLLARSSGVLTADTLVDAIVARNPWLKGYEDLARAIVVHPWRIRDPVDLARSAGLLEGGLRARCDRLGLKRTEHFITLVRWLAFEFLRSAEGMSARRARLVVGIADASNFRRQLSRALYSPRISSWGSE